MKLGKEDLLTVDMARALLEYDEKTGLFSWRRRRKGVRCARGLRAGSLVGNGYLAVWINYRRYYAHRLAWLYVHGRWPSKGIDHINGDKRDNRIANLREADQVHNLGNSVLRVTNTTGHKGVYRYKDGRFWAMVKYQGRNYYLGIFPTLHEAAASRRAKATELFGEFAREI